MQHSNFDEAIGFESLQQDTESESALLDDGDIDLDLTDTTHMQIWMEILEEQANTNDDIFKESLAPKSTTEAFDEEEGNHGWEIQPSPLEPLPLENDPKYPQEDAAYFRDKRYVRKDKYLLTTMVSYFWNGNEHCFPSILSGYKTSKASTAW